MNYQAYRGKLIYTPDLQAGAHRLLVAVPCRVGDFTDLVHALLDTGSTWCVLPPQLAEALGYEVVEGGIYRMHTRFGTFAGDLIREPVIFSPEAEAAGGGESDRVVIEATWFLASDWPGPLVIGWKGCLERMRFGFDPAENAFYFSEPTAGVL